VQAPWLKDLSQEELINLQGLELLLTWQEIIRYREWALIEIRIEAKRFMQSGIEVKPHNLTFTDIWVKCVDAEEIKMKGLGKNQIFNINEVELTFKEKTTLYEILATDKDQNLISFMNGETVERSSRKLTIDIELAALIFIVTELIYENDLEREKEFAKLNFLNMCRCMACLEKKSARYMEESHHDPNQSDHREERMENDLRFKSARKISTLENPSLGFNSHWVDVHNEANNESEHIKSSRDDHRQPFFKKELRFQENAMLSESLNSVCFLEILHVGGTLLFLKDGSVSTVNPISLQSLLIYDTTMLDQFNLLTFDKEIDLIDCDKKEAIYFKLNHEDRRTSRRDIDRKMKSDYRDSRILSIDTYEAILRSFIFGKTGLADFMDKLSIKRFISFLDHYDK
jgi:hypothetical protein